MAIELLQPLPLLTAQLAFVQVVIVVTWLIAAGGFVHVVSGGMEAFMLVFAGEIGAAFFVLDFFLPVLLGNIVGGTALFALLAYAQVMKEL